MAGLRVSNQNAPSAGGGRPEHLQQTEGLPHHFAGGLRAELLGEFHQQALTTAAARSSVMFELSTCPVPLTRGLTNWSDCL